MVVKLRDKEYRIEASVYAGVLYRRNFRSDILRDIMELVQLSQWLNDIRQDKESEIYVDSIIVYQLFYVYALLADDDLPGFEEFLKGIDVPMLEFFNAVVPALTKIVTGDMLTLKQKKFKAAPTTGEDASMETLMLRGLELGLTPDAMKDMSTGQLVDLLTEKRNEAEQAKSGKVYGSAEDLMNL